VNKLKMIEGRPRESLVQFENPTEVGDLAKQGVN
jgi:hypothetical protein